MPAACSAFTSSFSSLLAAAAPVASIPSLVAENLGASKSQDHGWPCFGKAGKGDALQCEHEQRCRWQDVWGTGETACRTMLGHACTAQVDSTSQDEATLMTCIHRRYLWCKQHRRTWGP